VRRRFGLMRALRGEHRPARVAAYGIALLLGYPIALFALLKTGAILALALDLERLGGGLTGASAVPLGLVGGYALLWLWFAVSLWNCANNAETRSGRHLARAACAAIAIVFVAGLLVSIGIPGLG